VLAVAGIATVAAAGGLGLSRFAGGGIQTFWPLLLWPALLVARLGLWHTWTVVAALVVAAAIGSARKPSRTRDLAVVVITAGVLYGAAGFLYQSRFPVPNIAPAVNELEEPDSRSPLYWPQYREAFETGYRAALVLGCFGSVHGSSGYVDGYWAGARMGLSELTRATSGWATPRAAWPPNRGTSHTE